MLAISGPGFGICKRSRSSSFRRMFRSRSVKHARLLVRHAEKLIRYRRDVLSEASLADIRRQIEAVERAIKGRDLAAVRQTSEGLDALVAQHSPSYREA